MANGGGSDIVAHFKTGIDVMKQFPATALPPLVVQVLMAVLTIAFIGGAVTAVAVGGAAGVAGALMGGAVFMLITALLSLISAAVTVIMARDAVAGRTPSIGDALNVVAGRLVDVIVASVLVMVIVGVGMLLLVVPGVIAGFFLIFTLPAVLLDNQGALDALKRSFNLVKDNIVPVLLFVVGCIVVGIVVSLVGRILGAVPILGQLLAAVLAGIAVAYCTIVGVRVYQTLPRR
jgi:hypothetical protein